MDPSEPNPHHIALATASFLVDAVRETFGPLGREVLTLKPQNLLIFYSILAFPV